MPSEPEIESVGPELKRVSISGYPVVGEIRKIRRTHFGARREGWRWIAYCPSCDAEILGRTAESSVRAAAWEFARHLEKRHPLT